MAELCRSDHCHKIFINEMKVVSGLYLYGTLFNPHKHFSSVWVFSCYYSPVLVTEKAKKDDFDH